MWMTTDKDEKELMEWSIKKCPEHAKVFVGGLGLGLTLLMLAHTKKTTEVLVVEKEQRVICTVEPIIRKWFNAYYPWFKWTVICGDAVEEVSKHEKWDWIFFDIWSDKYGKQDEPKEDEVKSKAAPYLTENGVLTIWIAVAREMHDAKVNPKLVKLIEETLGIIPLK
jgi:spermidine synthase